jgi:hypothetical protein
VKNLRIFAPLTNGQQLELADCPTGRDLITVLLGERQIWDARPQALVIEATDKEGQVIRIVIPYDDAESARVLVSPPES